MSDEEISNVIDPLLESIDKNNDGYIDYAEYKVATEKDDKK